MGTVLQQSGTGTGAAAPQAITGQQAEPAEAARASSSSGERLLFLDGMRGVLAMLVYIGHVNEFSGGAFGSSGVAAMGYRVAAFFALSGFVQYLSSAKLPDVQLNMPFKDFFKRRTLRLAPAYYATLILFLLFGLLVQMSGIIQGTVVDSSYLHSFWYHLALIQSWQPQEVRMRVNAPLWMMTYEWIYTMTIPLLLLLVRKFSWGVLLLGIGALLFLPGGWYGTYVLMPGYLMAFVLGMVASRVSRQRDGEHCIAGRFPLRWFSLALAGIGLTTFFALQTLLKSVDWMAPGTIPAIGQTMIGLSFAALCLHMTYVPRGWVARVFAVKPLVMVGTISYSLFLIHNPILMYQSWVIDHWHLDRFAPRWALYFLMFPVILLASTIFYRLFEAPFQTSRKKAAPTTDSPRVKA